MRNAMVLLLALVTYGSSLFMAALTSNSLPVPATLCASTSIFSANALIQKLELFYRRDQVGSPARILALQQRATQVLSLRTSAACWNEAGIVLAMLGGPEHIDHLIRFIESEHTTEYSAVSQAPGWIGLLGNRHPNTAASKRATAFLFASASTPSWRFGIETVHRGIASLGTKQARAFLLNAQKAETLLAMTHRSHLRLWQLAHDFWHPDGRGQYSIYKERSVALH